MQLNFDKNFFLASLITLTIGLAIFFFANGFIRGYLGDVVVIVFLYSLLSAFIDTAIIYRAIVIISFALIVELFQALITLPSNSATDLFLGASFDPLDIIAYIIGLMLIVIFEKAK